MNNLLGIKMNFNHERSYKKIGARNFKKFQKTTTEHIDDLIHSLERVKGYYLTHDKYIADILIDVYYNDIIAKTNRMQELLKQKSDCNNSIVGARFSDGEPGKENHIITHYINLATLEQAINKLTVAKKMIQEQLGGIADFDNFKHDDSSIEYDGYDYTKSKMRNIIIDCASIEKFGVPNAADESIDKDQLIITFYSTEVTLDDLFDLIGLDRNKYYYEHAGKNTISAPKETLTVLLQKIPYLISMVATDISQIAVSDIVTDEIREEHQIAKPHNEPTIGVIDTLFDTSVYFGEWVDYREALDFYEQTSVREEHFEHGTAISSLIVDGPQLNPWLDDGCGNFKVRHFGVCPGRISPTKLVYKIEKIVAENQDIHVWNLSLGTDDEVSKNFISFDAAALDVIQEKRNVIFVISGTNDNRNEKNGMLRIGSPADSVNSIVVNSVRKDGSPASYSRNGKVLSFFNKPDVSYYGGDYEDDERIVVYSNKGIDKQYGTSFAAPWISRKLCYLIDVLGMSREVAKAIIIDSAAGWEYKQGNYRYQNIIGYGVVPKKISNVINCDNSEIRFVLQGIANTYMTSNYVIPIPKDENGKCPYVARATLCYFPECNRLEGVDYTQRELSIKFGRVKDNGIIDINKNIQDDIGSYADERTSRRDFRKWENTKLISSLYKEKGSRALETYGDGYWGLALTSKERRRIAKQEELSFGVIITVKNIKGVNKINEFKHACLLKGFIVQDIIIDNQVELYAKAQEEIQFD